MDHSIATADSMYGTLEPETPSRAVVQTVAEAEGVDPTELPPLYGAIDPDKLDTLFDPRGRGPGTSTTTGEIRFTYHGYEVHVTADGRVTLDDS